MTKEEKEQIFDILKKADANLCGFTREKFKQNYIFEDDTTVEAKPVTENITEPANPTETVAATTIETEKTTENPKVTATSGITLKTLNEKILRCTRCGLARTRNNVVPGEGVENPVVMVIGEGPGYDEDMQGLPFVGKAGILLDKMLAAIDLSRKTNCYIANIVKCRPPENRDPFPDEQSACISFLETQIHILKPKMILCVGRIAGQKLLNTTRPVGELRGNFYDYNGIPLMITYHPSALLRNEALKRPAWDDLKKFRDKLKEITQSDKTE